MGQADSSGSLRYETHRRLGERAVRADELAGASSAVPREDLSAFSSQLEGTCRNSAVASGFNMHDEARLYFRA